MKQVPLAFLLALTVSYLTVPVSWAAQHQQMRENQQAVRLYQQCQDRLQKEPDNKEAKELCDEGMKLQREGKQEEAIQTIQEGLAKFKE